VLVPACWGWSCREYFETAGDSIRGMAGRIRRQYGIGALVFAILVSSSAEAEEEPGSAAEAAAHRRSNPEWAFRELATVSVLDLRTAGVGAPVNAFRALLDTRLTGHFNRLTREGTLAGQVYGLCGLYLVKRQSYARIAPRWQRMTSLVTLLTASESLTRTVGELIASGLGDASAGGFDNLCRDLAGQRLPHRATQFEIVTVMHSLQPRVDTCYARFKVAGTAMLNVQLGAGGQLLSAVVSGKHAGTPLAGCIEAAVRQLEFPPWDPVSFPWPVESRDPAGRRP
jgi:hypothetical protein